MNRGELYRTRHRRKDRGDKPGFYVIVSRQFIVENDDVSTVICAPVYGEVLGISTEVLVGPAEGLARESAVRCEFLALLFKSRLSQFVATLPAAKLAEVDRALAIAFDLAL